MSDTTISTKYMGWYRQDRRHPWRAVVAGEREDDAWDKLLDHVAGGDKRVLLEGQDPNQRGVGR